MYYVYPLCFSYFMMPWGCVSVSVCIKPRAQSAEGCVAFVPPLSLLLAPLSGSFRLSPYVLSCPVSASHAVCVCPMPQ